MKPELAFEEAWAPGPVNGVAPKPKVNDEARDATSEGPEQSSGWQAPELLPASRLLDTDFPPIEFAIEPYFPKCEITEIVGAHGIFKSTAAMDACLSVAAGRAWGGVAVAQGRAVFITMEDGERTLAKRVKAWLEGFPDGEERWGAEQDVRSNFSYLAREGAHDLALTNTDRNATTIRPVVVEHLAQLVSGATLVVLETASRLHDGPELNESLAVFARAVEQIAMGSGAAVAIVRHVSKQAARDQVVDSYAGRGGGALSDAARSVLVMTRDKNPDGEDGAEPDPFAPVRLTHAKATHSERGRRIVWKPVATEHGVYLRSVSEADDMRDAANRLLEHLRALGGEGLTSKALHNNKPAGLGRALAKRAVAVLLERGDVEEAVVFRGANRARATIYRVKEPSA